MAEEPPATSRFTWIVRFVLGLLVLVAMMAIVEVVLRKTTTTHSAIMDGVEIRSPAIFAAKVRHFVAQRGKKVIMLGDSLIAGQTMRDHGDGNWRKHTISAALQQRLDSLEGENTRVLNLGMNGVLPADLEAMIDGLILTKPEFLVINVSLRSFSQDFAAPDAQNSRDWLKDGVSFRKNGSIVRLPNQRGPANAIEKMLLNNWTTYRMRDALRARYINGEPRDLLQRVRDGIAAKGSAGPTGPAAEMRLLLQVRTRYSNVSLDAANPQFAAWTRMLAKLKAANQKTVIFYGTESPRLLPSLIDSARYNQLMDQLSGSVRSIGEPLRYIGPNKDLTDDVFLDHVHVNAAGNESYSKKILAAMSLDSTPRQHASMPLDFVFTPFVETVSADRVELGRITDFSTSSTPLDTPEKPRFDLKGMPVLSVEIRGREPHRDIAFLYHWWNKEGTPLGIRDSYHMLRASIVSRDDYPATIRNSLAKAGEDLEYVDVFAGIPTRIGAAQTAFYLQDSDMRTSRERKEKSLTLFGQTINRETRAEGLKVVRQTAPDRRDGVAQDLIQEIELSPVTGKEIVGSGFSFEVSNVSAVFTLRANHDLLPHTKAEEYVLGALVPHVIGYRTADGIDQVLTFSQADLIRFTFDPEVRKLLVDVYGYEFRERSTRGSKSYPDEDGRRVHPNLGIVSQLPAQTLTISHAHSSKLAFPLWQPNGAMASFAVTEHADFVGVAQDVMTMYGATTPTVIEGSGFLGNRIPLTKTIFPAGQPVPFRARTASSGETGPLVQSTVESDPEFLRSLQGYRADGHDVEIGIHCVGTASSTAQRRTQFVRRAIAAVAEFKPVTWVDHGGRDCLWESGWDPTSEHYIIPVLKDAGFKYLNMLGDKYDGRLNMIADNQPSNLLFYSVRLDDDLKDAWRPIVFNTVPIGFSKSDFTIEHIEQIIRARGLINVHTYLPYEALMFETETDGKKILKANPWYNQLLANLAKARREGKLHLATTETLNDFILKARSVHVYATGSVIHVQNSAQQKIPGLTIGYRSMAANDTAEATLGKGQPKGKSAHDGTSYLWFDLSP